MVLQLAFSVVLLTGAGLASRSAAMMQVDLGFESRNLLLVRISTAGSARTRDAHLAVLDQVREGLARIPGVQSVSYFGFRSRGLDAHARFSAAGTATVYAVGP